MTLTDTPTRNSAKKSGIEVDAVRFAYNGTPVLSEVDLSIAEGEFVCLVGPSGCGKTTLLRLLAGLETPVAGSIFWNGRAIAAPSLERGVVFQDYSLFPWIRRLRCRRITEATAPRHPSCCEFFMARRDFCFCWHCCWFGRG